MSNSKNVTRETIYSKKKKDPQDMPHDSAHQTSNPSIVPFSSQELREINIQIAASWFQAPKATQLTLMEVHPWRLHAYWNISVEDMEAARNQISVNVKESCLILRFIDLSRQRNQGIADHRFDIEVHGLTNSWYVDLWQDSRHYLAQLGLLKADGKLILLASSNEITLPRAAPSTELDFNQLEVRTPPPLAPLDLNVAETTAANSEYLLKNLYPGRRSEIEGFPKLIPTYSNSNPKETENPALLQVSSNLTERPTPFKPELEMIDHAHTVRSPVLTEHTEFPCVKNSELASYSIQANKNKARALANIEIELPPLVKETISAVDIDLTPKPLPLFSNKTEFTHNTLSNEPVLKHSNRTDSIETVAAQITPIQIAPIQIKINESSVLFRQAASTQTRSTQGVSTDLLRHGFPEIMPHTDNSSTNQPISKDNTGQKHKDSSNFQFPENVNKADHTHHDHRMNTNTNETESAQASLLSRPAPRPVIALEDALSNGLFSFGRNESALKVNAELHLHGKLETDSVLSLFGEQVHVDERGNFSVTLKLNNDLALSTLVYEQRKWNKGTH